MKRLKIKCKPLDDLLGGGIENGIITKIFGEAGSGKTNFCLQATRECVKTDKNVAFVDTEGVSVERLKQICKTFQNNEKYLDKIYFYNPTDLDSQEKVINDIIEKNKVGLIVIDTINLFYRTAHEDDKEIPKRSFLRQMANLQVAARKNDIYVVVTEQVYTDKNGEIKPFTHRDTEHMIKTSLRFDKKDAGERLATVIKHRSQPEGKTTVFKITACGLE
jgi:DNA repair protein RadB